MKHIHIYLEDYEYEEALERKGERTWKELFMENLS